MKSWSFRMLSMILLLGLLVGCPEPDELSITSVSAEDNPNSTLSAIVSVRTSKAATVQVEFWSDGIPAQVTPLSQSGTLHELTVAYEERKVIGALTGLGGVSDRLEEVLELSGRAWRPEAMAADREVHTREQAQCQTHGTQSLMVRP